MLDRNRPYVSLTPVFGRPEICVKCGYSLRGLAGDGRCPECGDAFSSETLMFLGKWPAWLKWNLVGVVVIAYHFWFRMMSDKWFTMVLAGMVGGLHFLILRNLMRPLAGSIYFQCDSAGFVIRNPLGKVCRIPWNPSLELHIMRFGRFHHGVYSLGNQMQLKVRVDEAGARPVQGWPEKCWGKHVTFEG